MADHQIRAAGISWFDEKDYLRARRIMADAHVLPLTFADWKQKAERQQAKFEAEGWVVYRAVIDPETFPRWCAERGLNVDAKARMAFANDYALRRIQN